MISLKEVATLEKEASVASLNLVAELISREAENFPYTIDKTQVFCEILELWGLDPLAQNDYTIRYSFLADVIKEEIRNIAPEVADSPTFDNFEKVKAFTEKVCDGLPISANALKISLLVVSNLWGVPFDETHSSEMQKSYRTQLFTKLLLNS